MRRLLLGLALSVVLFLPVHAQEAGLGPMCTLYILNASRQPVAGAWYIPSMERKGDIPIIEVGEHRDLIGPCDVGPMGVILVSKDPSTPQSEFIVIFGDEDHQFIVILERNSTIEIRT